MSKVLFKGQFIAHSEHGEDVLRVKFAPDGIHFATLGKNGTVGIYKIQVAASLSIEEVKRFSLGYQIDSGGLDLSPSGRYLMFGGALVPDENGETPIAPDLKIFEVANVPTRNLIVNNKKFAEGEVVVIEENFGIRITSLVKSKEEMETNGDIIHTK